MGSYDGSRKIPFSQSLNVCTSAFRSDWMQIDWRIAELGSRNRSNLRTKLAVGKTCVEPSSARVVRFGWKSSSREVVAWTLTIWSGGASTGW
jgi:hypothetical protein